jgi:SAM-dependent methyltransferase
MVRGIVEPRRWLDVGAADADFCVIARQEWPGTHFDVLDFNEGIEESVRCGRADHAYVGLFPVLAPSFENEYDVVSMSHYLEHTAAPRSEIAAARRALAPGGCLLIEVPDPASGFGRLLGRWWLPWVQPQHLHFLSAETLEKVLREQGFSVIDWQRREAHIGGDLAAALALVLNNLGPVSTLPWRPRGSRLDRLRAVFVWTLGVVPLFLAGLADAALTPLVGPLGLSDAYRVVARREDSGVQSDAFESSESTYH